MWADFASPIFVVFMKLWVAAADEPELYERLVAGERRIARAITGLVTEAVGEHAADEDVEGKVLLLFSACRGLALTEQFEPRSGVGATPGHAARRAAGAARPMKRAVAVIAACRRDAGRGCPRRRRRATDLRAAEPAGRPVDARRRARGRPHGPEGPRPAAGRLRATTRSAAIPCSGSSTAPTAAPTPGSRASRAGRRPPGDRRHARRRHVRDVHRLVERRRARRPGLVHLPPRGPAAGDRAPLPRSVPGAAGTRSPASRWVARARCATPRCCPATSAPSSGFSAAFPDMQSPASRRSASTCSRRPNGAAAAGLRDDLRPGGRSRTPRATARRRWRPTTSHTRIYLTSGDGINCPEDPVDPEHRARHRDRDRHQRAAGSRSPTPSAPRART